MRAVVVAVREPISALASRRTRVSEPGGGRRRLRQRPRRRRSGPDGKIERFMFLRSRGLGIVVQSGLDVLISRAAVSREGARGTGREGLAVEVVGGLGWCVEAGAVDDVGGVDAADCCGLLLLLLGGWRVLDAVARYGYFPGCWRF